MKSHYGYHWILGEAKEAIMEDFWTWAKVGGTNYDGRPVSGAKRYDEFEKEIWFELGKRIWQKHR